MSTLDPDILSIQRKRRREKRCLACGVPTPRAALCKACRQTRRYCPRCEAVWTPAALTPHAARGGRSTDYCPPCGNIVRNGTDHQPLAAYRAACAAQDHPKLSQMIRLYKQGLTYEQIADALDMNHGTLRATIAHARATGRWPKKLTRGKGWRKGKTNDRAAVAVER